MGSTNPSPSPLILLPCVVSLIFARCQGYKSAARTQTITHCLELVGVHWISNSHAACSVRATQGYGERKECRIRTEATTIQIERPYKHPYGRNPSAL